MRNVYRAKKNIFRLTTEERKGNFTIMSNHHMHNENLSWKAKGLHGYALSLKDDWNINLNHLMKESTDGETSLRSGIEELYKERYWQRYAVYINGVIDRYETKISELPFEEEEMIKSIVKRFKEGYCEVVINFLNGEIENYKVYSEDSNVVEMNKDLLCENHNSDKLKSDDLDSENQALSKTNTSTKNLLSNKHSFYQKGERVKDKEIDKMTREDIKEMMKLADINDYHQPYGDLIEDALLLLYNSPSIKAHNGIDNNSQIRKNLDYISYSICDDAIRRYSVQAKKTNIYNATSYFSTILYNSILTGRLLDSVWYEDVE